MKYFLPIFLTCASIFCVGSIQKSHSQAPITGWAFLDEYPFIYSDTSDSWHYFLPLFNDLYSYDYDKASWSKVQNSYDSPRLDYYDGLEKGRQEVVDSPSSFGLFSSSQYESRSTEKYNEGISTGIDRVKNNPSNYGLFASQNPDNTSYDQGVIAGIQAVLNSPHAYNLYTSVDIDTAYALGVASVTSGLTSWTKSQVTPIILVQESFGSFKPLDGYGSSFTTWTKSQVLPFIPVRESFGSFKPLDGYGSSFTTWTKSQVLPTISVRESFGSFVPLE